MPQEETMTPLSDEELTAFLADIGIQPKKTNPTEKEGTDFDGLFEDIDELTKKQNPKQLLQTLQEKQSPEKYPDYEGDDIPSLFTTLLYDNNTLLSNTPILQKKKFSKLWLVTILFFICGLFFGYYLKGEPNPKNDEKFTLLMEEIGELKKNIESLSYDFFFPIDFPLNPEFDACEMIEPLQPPSEHEKQLALSSSFSTNQ